MNQNQNTDTDQNTAHQAVTFGGVTMTRAEALAVMHACEWEQSRVDAWEQRQAARELASAPTEAPTESAPETVMEEPASVAEPVNEPADAPEAMPEPEQQPEPVIDNTGDGSAPEHATARHCADAYLAEPVNYGGETVTRGAMIADLQSKGATPAMVDAYLIGHAHGTAAQAEVDAEAQACETVTANKPHYFQNNNPAGWDSNCSVCDGKKRDCIHIDHNWQDADETVTPETGHAEKAAHETVTAEAGEDQDVSDTDASETDTLKTFTGSDYATYCPEDDKLRLYCGRVPRPEYERLRREGWTATPKQACAFVATWTPTRENTALEYADGGIIDDEDQSPADRAADRAERFAGYRDKRRDEAHGNADAYEAGPKLLGYQSAALAERKARALERTADRAVNLWGKAEYWQYRTAGVIAHALHVSTPGVRMGRIKILEAEQRKLEKDGREGAEKAQAIFDLWHALAFGGKLPRKAGPLYALDNIDEKPAGEDGKLTMDQYRLGVALSLSGYGTATHRALASKTVTPVQAAAAFLEEHATRPVDWQPCGRWYEHITLRLAYENQMLEAQGGRAAHVEMIPGGWIGNKQILKVNKSSVTGRVVSVGLKVPSVTGWHYGIKNVPGTDYAIMTLETERLASSVYRAPTEAELEVFNAAKKADKKAKADATPKAAPLVNPTREDAERLQAIWNDRALAAFKARNGHLCGTFEPATVLELTQNQYGEISRGSYAKAETRELCHYGKLKSRFTGMWSSSAQKHNDDCGAVLCKIRVAGVFDKKRVIVLTDKPGKPLPELALADRPQPEQASA